MLTLKQAVSQVLTLKQAMSPMLTLKQAVAVAREKRQ
jgi:hypothetical protein